MKKIKIFSSTNPDKIEKEINEFLVNKKLIDLKCNTTAIPINNCIGIDYLYTLTYEEQKNNELYAYCLYQNENNCIKEDFLSKKEDAVYAFTRKAESFKKIFSEKNSRNGSFRHSMDSFYFHFFTDDNKEISLKLYIKHILETDEWNDSAISEAEKYNYTVQYKLKTLTGEILPPVIYTVSWVQNSKKYCDVSYTTEENAKSAFKKAIRYYHYLFEENGKDQLGMTYDDCIRENRCHFYGDELSIRKSITNNPILIPPKDDND